MPTPQTPHHVGRAARQTGHLALGSALSGLLAYVVFALTTHALGAGAAAPASVLWSYWAFATAAFTFSFQHWIARTSTAHGERSVRETLPRLVAILVVASLLLGGLAWVARNPLFHRSDAWFPLMVAAVTLGCGLTGVVRGALSARERFTSVSAGLVLENLIRSAVVAALVVAGDRNVVLFGLGLVAGHLMVLAWPSAWRFGTDGDGRGAPNPFVFMAGAGLAQLLGQVVLTGGPVLLALTGGSQRQVTTLFAALALFRAPYMLALGMVAQLTTRVAILASSGDVGSLRAQRRLVWGATAVVALVAAGGGAWLGPPLLRIVFGPGVVLGRGPTAVVAVGCTVAVGSLVLMVSALAQGRAGAAARAWMGGALAAAVGFVALSSFAAEDTVVACFLVAEVAAFALLSVVERRVPHAGRPVDVGASRATD